MLRTNTQLRTALHKIFVLHVLLYVLGYFIDHLSILIYTHIHMKMG